MNLQESDGKLLLSFSAKCQTNSTEVGEVSKTYTLHVLGMRDAAGLYAVLKSYDNDKLRKRLEILHPLISGSSGFSKFNCF